jgi:hypothetical protein
MKICCGEVIYTIPGKDFVICPKCNGVMFVNEDKGSKNGNRPPRKRAKGQNTMGFSR